MYVMYVLYDKNEMFSCGIFTFLVCILYTQNVRSDDYILQINANSSSAHFYHFWESTGFCPPEPRSNICDYLLSNDIKLNIVLLGVLPNKSIKYLRIHWLLDLITIRSFKNNGDPVFDFKCMDMFFDLLYSQNLKLHFEIMGNPSSYFNNFLNKSQKRIYEGLIRDLILKYVERYGEKYISKWRFETWNEPDLKGYNTMNFTFSSYISYINSTYTALSSVLPPPLHFGGPAGLFKSKTHHLLCWGLLDYCFKNKNNSKCSFDYFSFHKKGDSTSEGVINKGWGLVKQVRAMYPGLKQLKIANTEADIETGWSKSFDWHGDVRYAAMVAKVIIDHYNKFIKENGIDIEVLSNDNGFLNYHPYYFTQRTLLTRFQMNNSHPPYTQFIKKPVYTTMALLSFLGRRVLNLSPPTHPNFSFLATTSRDKLEEFSILFVYANDTQHSQNTTNIQLAVSNLPALQYKYILYWIDNIKCNPYRIWKEMGAPVFPNDTVRQRMRQVEGPIRTGPTSLDKNFINIQISATLPTVGLIHICADSGSKPGQVTGLKIFNITNNEVLIVWKDRNVNTKCVRTYEVELKRSGGVFRRVNDDDVIFLSFQYTARGINATTGTYRVRAIDYWDRFGPYSNPVHFPTN